MSCIKHLVMRNVIGLVLLLCMVSLGCGKSNTPIVTVNSIISQISEPTIPDYEISLIDFGAIGDSVSDNKDAFDAAIASLKAKGGGKLIVPCGVYKINGAIHFTSHLNLHLDSGAILKFSSDPIDFLPVVLTSWEGTLVYNYSPFIYAYQCSDVAITGKGVIDGEASESWQLWKKKQKPDQMASRDMNHKSVPVSERIFGEGHFLRPHLIQFFECKNILMQDVTIEDSPFWCVHLFKCESATLRGLKYNAHNKNNDGIDPEYSRNILIENIEFNNGDDNVAIKAGRDNEGRQTKMPSENIVIRNCSFKGLHAVVMGSEMSSGVQNIFVENCTYGGYLKRGIYLKSNPDRGGFIRNIFVKNIEFGEVEDCFYITSFYHQEGEGNVTDISNVYIENVTCKTVRGTGVVIQGFPNKKVKDVYLKNIVINSANNAISLVDTENIVFQDVIIGESATPPSFAK